MLRNCIYPIYFSEEADSVSINSCCSGGAGSNGSERDGGLSNSTISNTSPKPKKPNRTSFDLQPTWIRRSYEQLHSVSVKPNLVYSSGSNYSRLLLLLVAFSQIFFKYLQLWPFAYVRLLTKPYENEVTLRGQDLPLNVAILMNS